MRTSCTLFPMQGGPGKLAASRVVHVDEVTAAGCESQILLFRKRSIDGMVASRITMVEHPRRELKKCHDFSLTTATADSLVRS